MWAENNSEKGKSDRTMTREEVTKHLNILLANRCLDCLGIAGNKVCDEKCMFKQAFNEAIEALSADAVQGEWIHDGQNFKGGLDWCHCSECGCKTSANGLSMYNYCPNCGARMKGGDSKWQE